MLKGVGLIVTPNHSFVLELSGEARHSIEQRVGAANADTYTAFVTSYVALLADSPLECKPPIVAERFAHRLCFGSPRDLILGYASLADELMASCHHSSEDTITGSFLRGMMKTPVFPEYLCFYRTGDIRCLQFVLSFLLYGKKMDYVDDQLGANAFRDWSLIESEMRTFEVSEKIAGLMKAIISQLIGPIDDTILLPKHGPGYVSEGFLDPIDKNDHLSIDPRTRYAFRTGSFGRTGVDRASLEPFLGRRDQEQVAKLKLVFKDIKTMRSICMEPASRMYLQQEVARWLLDAMERSPIALMVDLTDQTINQEMAKAGSCTQTCDTIDLSAASDRVHIDLVKRIFPPKILYYLLATRTNRVRVPDGSIVTLQKFAPMGSALCFPVQCVVFSACVLLAYLEQHYGQDSCDSNTNDWYYLGHIREFIARMPSDPWEYSSRLLRPRVYGDDIICDTRVTDRVLNLLTLIGLKVNAQKSFTSDQMIRESCGIYAYNGTDVTPLRFRIPIYRAKQLDVTAYASFIGSINRARDMGYSHVASAQLALLRRTSAYIRGTKSRRLGMFIPFVTRKDDFGILTTRASKPERYNADYQRDECRRAVLYALRGRRRSNCLMERYAYDQWMRARIRGGSIENNYSIARIRPQAMGIRLEWLPV